MPGKSRSEERGAPDQSSRKRSRNEFEDDAANTGGQSVKKHYDSRLSPGLIGLKSGLQSVLDGSYPPEVKKRAQQLDRLLFRNSLVYGDDDGATTNSNGVSKVVRPPVKQELPVSTVNSLTDVPLRSSSTTIPTSSQEAPEVSPYVTVPSFDSVVPSGAPSMWPPQLPPITNVTLQSAPFTHSSTLPSYIRQTNTNCYDPLEFLGDAYLEVIATRLIHARFPEYPVGQKSQLRERLVNNETLAGFARTYGFDNRVHATQIQKTQGKGGFTKVLADCFEAYIAAIILSQPADGFVTVERWLTELWAPKIQDWSNTTGRVVIAESAHPEAKKDLENLIVNSRAAKLEYLEEKPMQVSKENNRQQFFFGVYITGYGYERRRLGSGVGRSKAIAGLEAAKDALINNRKLVEEAHRRKMEFEKRNPKPSKAQQNGKAHGK